RTLTITYTITGATIRAGNGNDASGIFNLGISTIIWTVADPCGNTSTCSTLLTISNGVHTDTLVSACKQYTWPRNGQVYTVGGSYDYIFDNAQGCKDTVTLKLTISNGVHTDTTVRACKRYTWNRNGQTYTTCQSDD